MAFRPLEIEGRFGSPPDTTIELDGRSYSARSGEPLAVTLLAHGEYVLGRSPKYHRGRGLVCGRGGCGACLARVDGEPNQRLCLCRAGEHRTISSQNTVGGAKRDLLAAIDWVFASGLDHHHLMTHSTVLNRFAVGFAHRLAGLGTLPDPSSNGAGAPPETLRARVVVVGAGPAGRAAAAVTRERGLETLVFDALADDDGVVLGRSYVLGQYDERELLVSRHGRQVRVSAEAVIVATGAHEQAPACPGNDLPGLFLRRAAELALAWGVLPGRRVVLAVSERADDSTRQATVRLARLLGQAGADVRAIAGPVDAREAARVLPRAQLAAIEGGRTVHAARLAPDDHLVDCDAVIWCARPAPAYELARQMGVEARFSPELDGFVPVCRADGATDRAGVFVAGEAAGIEAAGALTHGRRVGAAVADQLARSAQEARPS